MNYRSIVLFGVVFLAAMLLVDIELVAQCPMCKMSAEQNLKDGGTAGAGLNKGILYMLCMPYLLVASLGYLWVRNRNKWTEEIHEEPFSDN